MHQRSGDDGPGAEAADVVDLLVELGVGGGVDDVDRLAGAQNVAGDAQRGVELAAQQDLATVTGGGGDEELSRAWLDQQHAAGLGVTNSRGQAGDGVQHDVQVEGGVDGRGRLGQRRERLGRQRPGGKPEIGVG